ncbi:MAG TPA: glycine cleavage system aminomethyltransferase GcvT [Devosiaceae bacterium]
MAQSQIETAKEPLHTALFERHVALGGRMVDFAGYSLPVQYSGIVAEHLHTRKAASLFDVSHMGQVTVGGADFESTAGALEQLLPGDLFGLAPGEMRYTVLLNQSGGIEDDLIVTRPVEGQAPAGTLFIVVNAARKHHDVALMRNRLPGLDFTLHDDRALIALQGPQAADVLREFTDAPDRLGFMQSMPSTFDGADVQISRSGYTGEDGFEIAVSDADADRVAERLLSNPLVLPAGLGARDSLRLESGLCLYGHDMDDGIDPVSAGLLFAIGKHRRQAGGFAGADQVLEVLREGPAKKRVGIQFEGRMPVREGAELVGPDGEVIGRVTSGTFSPSLQAPIAMGYVPVGLAATGTTINATVRGKMVTGVVTKMPFVPQNYVRRAPGTQA